MEFLDDSYRGSEGLQSADAKQRNLPFGKEICAVARERRMVKNLNCVEKAWFPVS
jgi:hypothetical protein